MSPKKNILTKPGFGLALAFGMALGSAAVAAQTLQPGATVVHPNDCPSDRARFDEWSAGSTASYEELVGDAKAGHIPEGLDLRQLRLKYAESPSYDPEAGSAEISEMNQKLADKDYDAALQIASDILAKQYVNIDANRVMAKVYDEWSHDSDQYKACFFTGAAKLHYLIALGLTRSIYASAGDGKNPNCQYSYGESCGTSIGTALKLISLQEEDALARGGGLQLVKRSSMKEGGHSYDVVNFVNTNVVHCAACGSADNSPVTLYFDVTVPQQYAEKSLSR